MKKIISILLIVLSIVTFPIVTVNCVDVAEFINVYSADGSSIQIFAKDLEVYKNAGWYADYNDVVTTIYAPDGRSANIYIAELPTYLNLGWYENYSDVVKTLCTEKGAEIVVYLSEVELYKKLGWSLKEDVTSILCAPDGRQIAVFNYEVPTYLNLGWSLAQSIKINPAKPMVALTYDDGPTPETTDKIIDIYKRFNARTTFFVLGGLVERYPDSIIKMKEASCQVGNHSYDHPELTKIALSTVGNQLDATNAVIERVSGSKPVVMRPPYGSHNKDIRNLAGVPVIMWSVDTLDWQNRDAKIVSEAVLNNVKDGDIVLMHDIYKTTVEATEIIVPELIRRGYQLVTVEELARYKGVNLQVGEYYSKIN